MADTTHVTGKLRVKVIGLKSNNGAIRIALFNSQKNYSDNIIKFRMVELEIKDQKCEWIVENIPQGEYAIRIFHDENKKLDTNLFGIPKEPYGFSNNAKASFGPPMYEKIKFMLKKKTKTLEIKLEE